MPKRIRYDNSKITVARIVGKRERELTDAFLKLESHLLFESHFCLVRRPNERPVGLFCLDGRPHLKLVQVRAPNLGAYRALVAGGAS